MWSTVYELTRQQHGVVARRQLVRAGISPAQVHGAVRRGRLVPVARGVYGLPGHALGPLGEVMAAVLRAGEGARATGERMLAAVGVRDADPGGSFTVLVPASRVLTAVDFVWRQDRHADLGAAATLQRIPTWNVVRNLLEAAIQVPEDEALHRLADGVRRRNWRDARAASTTALAAPDHAGARRLVRIGATDADAAESTPERVLEHLLWDLEPRRQVSLLGHRVDLYLPGLRVVVEYDGRADHSSQAARLRDRQRDMDLTAAGYRVVRVTAEDLRDPAAVRARILGLPA